MGKASRAGRVGGAVLVLACVACLGAFFHHQSVTSTVLVSKSTAGQVGANGEGQVGNAVGPWRHSREVSESSHHRPGELDFTVPLDKNSRLKKGLDSHMAKGLGFDELSIHTRLEQPNDAYASEFPHSYFAAQPNPQSKYTWVCPGPSLLDDPHSDACPQSTTVGFRCCIDAENGGAVADNMCCPKQEVELRSEGFKVYRKELARKLSGDLLKIVEKLELAQAKARKVAEPPHYESASTADRDIDSYFNSLSSKPPAVRWMPASKAKAQLSDFFHKLDAQPAQPKPMPVVVPNPGDDDVVRKVAGEYANMIAPELETAEQKQHEADYARWQRRSEGDEGGKEKGFAERLADQQARSRDVASKDGDASAEEWDRRRLRFYTDVHGKVPESFARSWGASRDGVEVPQGNVRVE